MTRADETTTIGRAGPRLGALLSTVFLGQFLVALDISLLNVALPDIQRGLGFTAAGLQWVVSAYLLTFAGFMLLGGRLGDVIGRRAVLLTGLVLFLLASLWGGLAWDSGSLIAARALQGIAGALIAPSSLALVAADVPEASRGKAMGLWSGAGAGGGAVGVVLSGVLADGFGWRAVLLVNIPIVLVALVTTLRGVPKRGTTGRTRLDVPGAVLVTAGVAALVFAVSSAGDHGWGSAQVVIGFVAAAVLLGAFVAVEARSAHPLMPLRLFAVRSVVGANVFGFLLSAGQLAAFYFTSLYMQTVWELSPTATGLLFLPFCAFVGAGIGLALTLSRRIGIRSTLLILGVVGAAGLGGFALLPDEFAFWTGVLIPSALGGIGIGGSLVLLGRAALTGVAESDAGVASGVLNSSRQLGGTIGLAVLVTAAASVTAASAAAPGPVALGEGFRYGLGLGAVLLLAGAVLAFLIVPSRTSSS